jgi:hypothetical protein
MQSSCRNTVATAADELPRAGDGSVEPRQGGRLHEAGSGYGLRCHFVARTYRPHEAALLPPAWHRPPLPLQ